MSLFKRSKSRKKQKQNVRASHPQDHNPLSPDQWLQKHAEDEINENTADTVSIIHNLLGKSDDFVIHHFHVFGHYPAALCYFPTLADEDIVNIQILKPLVSLPNPSHAKSEDHYNLKNHLINDVLNVSKV